MTEPVPSAEERAAWRAEANTPQYTNGWRACERILRLLDALEARDAENFTLMAALEGVLRMERARVGLADVDCGSPACEHGCGNAAPQEPR